MGPRALLLPLAAVVVAAAPAHAQAPFAAGWRWQCDAPVGEPYLPQALVAAAGGELFFGGLGLAHAGVALYGGQAELGGSAELARDGWCAGALGPVAVGASAGARLTSLAQFALPGGARRTELAVHRAAGASAARFDPEHVVVLPWLVQGRALLAAPRDGARVAVALHDPAAGLVHLAWIAAADGALDGALSIVAPALRAAASDASGARFAFSLGTRVEVRDGAGALLFAAPLDFASDALALSGDGRTLAVGAKGRVRLWRETSAGWTALPELAAAPLELPTALALDHVGEFLAVGWWDAVTGQAARAETHDLAAGVRVHAFAEAATSGKQNTVSAARVTPDGRRAAFAFWGQGGAEPEAVLLDRASAQPLAALDLPGSALALALDDAGTRLAVAHKSAHANEVAGTGGVRLYDTGERDVELSATLRTGAASVVHVEAPAALAAWLLVGVPAPVPLPLGALGSLALDPAAPHVWVPLAGGATAASAALVVPGDAALSGAEFALQGLVLDAAPRLSVTAVRAPVL